MHGRVKSDLEQEMLAKAQREERATWKVKRTEWTTTEIQRLKRLWFKGMTYEEIGGYLGRSRNSVGGMVKRLRDRGDF